MKVLSLIITFVSIIIFLAGGVMFSKAERQYIKRVGRKSGWAYPWDVIHYEGKEVKYLKYSAGLIVLGVMSYFIGSWLLRIMHS